MWTTEYIISQVFVIVAYLLVATSFFTKDKNKILILNILCVICYMTAYIFLGAKSGIIINAVNFVRCIWYYINTKLNRQKDYISLSVCLALLLIFSIIFASSWYDAFAITAGILVTYSLWQGKVDIYRWSMILCSVCWIVYGVYLMSIFSIIGESCLLVVGINSVLHYYVVDRYDISRKMFYTALKIYSGDKSGHSFSHIMRVLKLCKTLQMSEGGDWQIISTAAIFHDIHRIMSNEAGRFVSPEESIEKLKEILKPFNIDKEKLEKILFIVSNHENKSMDFDDIEAKIVVDADNLDSLGKIGFKRTIKYCKAKKIPIDSDINLNSKKYIPDINPISAKHYIFRTLIPNSKNLKTKTGKKLADEKRKVLENLFAKKFQKSAKN